MDLASRLHEAFSAAIRAAFPDAPSTDPVLRRSDRADFQANAGLALAKALKKKPQDVAAAIVEKVALPDVIDKLEVSGPGFINVTLKSEAIARAVEAIAAQADLAPRAASPEKVVIDYSAPNVAKELHVGHLRSTVIGDAIARVLEATGHTVIRQNHLGDWGTPFGMLIEHLIDLHPTDALTIDLTISDLDGFYKAARAKFEGDEAFAARARQRVVALQGGDADSRVLWLKLCAESRRYFQAAYDRLGVTLKDSDVAGESSFGPDLPGIVEEVMTKLGPSGEARESEGALCLFPPGFTGGKEGHPLPLIIRKNDGGYGYATTDLAAIKHRIQKLGATRLLYVVGAPQSQHLAMIYASAKLMGWLAPPVRAEHVAFGSILGPDKKMFKTRSGDTVKLLGLIDEGTEKALAVVREKSPELDDASKRENARAIAVGAIKYADLSSDRIKDYIFDWDRMLAFEGNTAPYMMYACARVSSIARKAGADGGSARLGAVLLVHPSERALALELTEYAATVSAVEASLEPHTLCTYLFTVASRFSTFFHDCPVLRAETPELRAARLTLTALTARVLSHGLGLLGIETLERM
ncbi:MAG: arginine--tRNA ligase [Polyangiaceae bacterium]